MRTLILSCAAGRRSGRAAAAAAAAAAAVAYQHSAAAEQQVSTPVARKSSHGNTWIHCSNPFFGSMRLWSQEGHLLHREKYNSRPLCRQE